MDFEVANPSRTVEGGWDLSTPRHYTGIGRDWFSSRSNHRSMAHVLGHVQSELSDKHKIAGDAGRSVHGTRHQAQR